MHFQRTSLSDMYKMEYRNQTVLRTITIGMVRVGVRVRVRVRL